MHINHDTELTIFFCTFSFLHIFTLCNLIFFSFSEHISPYRIRQVIVRTFYRLASLPLRNSVSVDERRKPLYTFLHYTLHISFQYSVPFKFWNAHVQWCIQVCLLTVFNFCTIRWKSNMRGWFDRALEFGQIIFCTNWWIFFKFRGKKCSCVKWLDERSLPRLRSDSLNV